MSPPPGCRDERDRPVSPPVLDEAIAWQLRLGSGEASPAEHHRLSRWLAADAEHARAWRQLGEIDSVLAPARGLATRAALLKKPAARRFGAAALGIALALFAGLAAVDRFQPVGQLLADHRTGTGERRRVVLPDGTVVHLNTRSAIDLAFDAERRAIVLVGGEIHVETGHADPGEGRPFVVLTAEGSLRALGTLFLVRRLEAGDTRLAVTHSAVAVRPAACAPQPAAPCAAEQVVGAGESVRLTAAGAAAPVAAPANADAWKDGVLVLNNQPLAEVVAELARHRPGHLGVDPRVADLRVTGTLPLADTDQALQALTAAVPVDIKYRTRGWVRVVPRQK